MVLDSLDRGGPLRNIFSGRPLRHNDGVRVEVVPRNFRQSIDDAVLTLYQRKRVSRLENQAEENIRQLDSHG
jgi:hypothetical protein